MKNKLFSIEIADNWTLVSCPVAYGLDDSNRFNIKYDDCRWGQVIESLNFPNYKPMVFIPISRSIKCGDSLNYVDYYVRDSDILKIAMPKPK